MKVNNNIKTIITATATVLLLSACGGGKKETKPVVTTDPVVTADPVVTVPKCETITYLALKKNDKITALQDGTEIIVRHKSDGTRETCIKTGNVKIN